MNKYFVKKEGKTYFETSKTDVSCIKFGQIDEQFKKAAYSSQSAKPERILKKYAIKQS